MRTALLLAVALAQLPSMRQALDLGRTNDEAMLAAFNRGYELTPGDSINRAEIITEFRRAVLIVRERMTHGQPSFSEHDLANEMAAYDGQVAFIVEARLHPHNMYRSAPSYLLYVETGKSTKPIPPKPFKRDAVLPVGAVGPGNTIVAVRLEGSFAREAIAAAAAPKLVVIDDQANVVWKTPIDLTRYR